MTDDEKREQKAMLLLETQEAEELLAQLQEKMYRISEDVQEVSRWMKDQRGVGDVMYRSEVNQRAARVTTGKQYREALNFDAAIDLSNQLHAARSKVEELHGRKKALGLK